MDISLRDLAGLFATADMEAAVTSLAAALDQASDIETLAALAETAIDAIEDPINEIESSLGSIVDGTNLPAMHPLATAAAAALTTLGVLVEINDSFDDAELLEKAGAVIEQAAAISATIGASRRRRLDDASIDSAVEAAEAFVQQASQLSNQLAGAIDEEVIRLLVNAVGSATKTVADAISNSTTVDVAALASAATTAADQIAQLENLAGDPAGNEESILALAASVADTAKLVAAALPAGSEAADALSTATAAVEATTAEASDLWAKNQQAGAILLTVEDLEVVTGVVDAASPPPLPTIASPPPAELSAGESAITSEEEDQGWIAAPVVVGFLFLLLVSFCCYAHIFYPGRVLTWLRLKTTHSNMAVPIFYMNKEVRDAMRADLRASAAKEHTEQAAFDKADDIVAEQTERLPGGDIEAGSASAAEKI